MLEKSYLESVISSGGKFLRESVWRIEESVEFLKVPDILRSWVTKVGGFQRLNNGENTRTTRWSGYLSSNYWFAEKMRVQWYIPLEKDFQKKKEKKKEEGKKFFPTRSLIKHFPMFWNNQIITINPRKQRKWKLYLSPFDRELVRDFSSLILSHPHRKWRS